MNMKPNGSFRFRLAALLAAVVLAGCAAQRVNFPPPDRGAQIPPQPPGDTTPLPSGQPPQVSRPPVVAEPPATMPPRTPEEISSPAVIALLGRSDTLARAGHMDMAAATLERALNLEPRNPFVYQRLASVRLAQGQAGQAEALARKSNSLAVGNPFVHASNWALIAEARRVAGDAAGTREAITKANEYRRQSAALQ